jgi:hypothetical protein
VEVQDGEYLIYGGALNELRRHVIEQANAAESQLVERLLGQLASLHVHSQHRADEEPLRFRPTPATAQLAERAVIALRSAEQLPGATPTTPSMTV